MKLKFPRLGGGVSQGLNDAGLEEFEDDYERYIVRECIQNSLDAKETFPISVKISKHFIDVSDLPVIKQLEEIFNSAISFWKSDEKTVGFFRNSKKHLANQKIIALKISDENTKGLDGNDDERDKPWYGLVRSRGVSNKLEKDSGGSFGIGKDAPLAGSALRTVLYSTKTRSEKTAFQGVCRLVTHLDSENEETQGTGYIGDCDETNPYKLKFSAIRDNSRIPSVFRRDKVGLDVWVLGPRIKTSDDWYEPFLKASIRDFWPAIHQGKLIVTIGNIEINKSNIQEFFNKYSNDSKLSESYKYYLALTDPDRKEFEETVGKAGKCKLYIIQSKKDLPSRICMTRSTGMVIYPYRPIVQVSSFAGLFICDDKKGNELLKSLEPAKHDVWSSTREGVEGAQQALKEIKDWVKEKIKSVVPGLNQDSFNETNVTPELIEDYSPENPNPEDSSNDEGLGTVPSSGTVIGKANARTAEKAKKPGKKGTRRGNGNIISPHTNNTTKGKGRRSRKQLTTGLESTSEPNYPLPTRSFPTTDDYSRYTMVVRSEQDYKGPIFVQAIGEDSSGIDIDIKNATIEGTNFTVTGGRIDQVVIKKNTPTKIKLELEGRSADKFSLKAMIP
jgi:hypothetical protein